MGTSWIVQNNLPGSKSAESLRRVCLDLRLPFYEVGVTARSQVPPAMPAAPWPFVLHGGTTFILHALASENWRRGLFFDPDKFKHEAYAVHYGLRLLNAGAKLTRWSELLREEWGKDESAFVKPNDDLKQFTGAVLSMAQLRKMDLDLKRIGVPIDAETKVVVADAVEVDGEWRLFLVDGHVVSGSMYRPTGEPSLPAEVVSFAEEAAQVWSPAPVFVMDVARCEATWKIVECNCFNGSGFYLADVARIVAEVSKFQETAATT